MSIKLKQSRQRDVLEHDKQTETGKRYRMAAGSMNKFEEIATKAISTVLKHGLAYSTSDGPSRNGDFSEGLHWNGGRVIIEYINCEVNADSKNLRLLNIDYNTGNNLGINVFRALVAKGEIREILHFEAESGKDDYRFRWIEKLNTECDNANKIERVRKLQRA
ncbi:MAG: hypothetical protein ACHQX1_01060 [Candidatus Micrarchaeales archaeon]